MEFFVVEDEPVDFATLTTALKVLYPKAVISPSNTFSTWNDAFDAIQKQTKDAKDLIFILDLAIPSTRNAVAEGVQYASSIKRIRPTSSFIAYTTYPERAELEPHYPQVFSGVIDKGEVTSCFTQEKERTYIRSVLEDALDAEWFGHQNRRQNISRTDSIGLRMFESAFGKNTCYDLAGEIAPDWETIEVSAPSQGHSGTFVISVKGVKEGCQQALILKCARDKSALEDELRAPGKFFSELGGLAKLIHFMDPQPTRFSNGRGYYYRQAAITGANLLEILYENHWNSHARTCLAAIVSCEEEHCKQPEGTYAKAPAITKFELSDTDTQRALSSRLFLETIGDHILSVSHWPTDLPDPRQVSDSVMGMVTAWNSKVREDQFLFHLAQHGDLHPANIMVAHQERVQLIDPARLDRWPVGYDLSRLATMIHVRIPYHDKCLDWVENDIRKWDETFCCIDREISPDNVPCPPAVYCDQAFRRVILSRPVTDRSILERGYVMGTLWDLIKVMSYQDLSPFKRVWALVNCWRLGLRLGFITK
jgi:hypothetical protein